MKNAFALTGIALSLLPLSAHASPAKMKMAKMKPAKMVTLYQAAKCHMYYTPAQAKKYNYACPDSKGKMTKVMVTPAVAKTGIAATDKALAPKKAM